MPLFNVTGVSSLASGKTKGFVETFSEDGNIYESYRPLNGFLSRTDFEIIV